MRSGQLRGLAVTTLKRFPTAPELPTIAESGIPGFDVSSWYALFVPAKTPPEIIASLNAATGVDRAANRYPTTRRDQASRMAAK